jgi:maleate isomerase
MDVIAWNGTSAAWLGFQSDHRLCAAITDATGAPATSSVLAINDALDRVGARTIGLVSPYTADVQDRIVATYAASGRHVIAERHLDDPGNYSFARYDEHQVAVLVRQVAAARPDAIVILCTNMRGARAVPALEQALGIPVVDSIAATLWKCLLLAGAEPARIQGWGRLFAMQQIAGPAGTHASPDV